MVTRTTCTLFSWCALMTDLSSSCMLLVVSGHVSWHSVMKGVNTTAFPLNAANVSCLPVSSVNSMDVTDDGSAWFSVVPIDRLGFLGDVGANCPIAAATRIKPTTPKPAISGRLSRIVAPARPHVRVAAERLQIRVVGRKLSLVVVQCQRSRSGQRPPGQRILPRRLHPRTTVERTTRAGRAGEQNQHHDQHHEVAADPHRGATSREVSEQTRRPDS